MAEGRKVVEEVVLPVSAPGAEKTGQQFSKLARELRDLNKAGQSTGLTGEGGLIGILKGAGVAAGVGLATRALKEVLDVTREINKGTLSASEGLLKMADAVPILGQIVQLGQSIRSIFDDTADEIERINKAAGRGNAVADLMKGNRETTEAAGRASAGRQQGLSNQFALGGLSGFARDFAENDQRTGAAQQNIFDDLFAARDRRAAKDLVLIRKLEKERNEIKVEGPAFGDVSGALGGNKENIAKADRARGEIQSQIDAIRNQQAKDFAAGFADALKEEGLFVELQNQQREEIERRQASEEAERDRKLKESGQKALGDLFGQGITFAGGALRNLFTGGPADKARGGGGSLPQFASLVESRSLQGVSGVNPVQRAAERTAKATEQTQIKIERLASTVTSLTDFLRGIFRPAEPS